MLHRTSKAKAKTDGNESAKNQIKFKTDASRMHRMEQRWSKTRQHGEGKERMKETTARTTNYNNDQHTATRIGKAHAGHWTLEGL